MKWEASKQKRQNREGERGKHKNETRTAERERASEKKIGTRERLRRGLLPRPGAPFWGGHSRPFSLPWFLSSEQRADHSDELENEGERMSQISRVFLYNSSQKKQSKVY